MRRYIVIGLLLMCGKGMATTGIPTDVEVCSAGVLTKGDQGSAGVLIKEGKYCERELNEDASKVVIFTLDGGSDPSCEDTGECTDVIIEPKDPPTGGSGGSGGSGGTSGSDWLNKMLIPKRGTPYRNRALGFDCVSSTSFSPVFSSLGGCSGSPAGRDDQPKSPKPEPKEAKPQEELTPEMIRKSLLANSYPEKWETGVFFDDEPCLYKVDGNVILLIRSSILDGRTNLYAIILPNKYEIYLIRNSFASANLSTVAWRSADGRVFTNYLAKKLDEAILNTILDKGFDKLKEIKRK
ncbi:MAG: hypothetical protein U0Z75_05415 [Deinococcaceae bacterium]